jgi:FkbH-like protein
MFFIRRSFALPNSSNERLEHKWTIAVSANFTAEPLGDSLSFWMKELEFPCAVEFGPYDQVFQQLLDPGSTLSKNKGGLNVVLIRLEDWARGASEMKSGFEGEGGVEERLERHASVLTAALRTAGEQSAVPCLLCLCPASRQFQTNESLASFLQSLEGHIARSLNDSRGIHVVTSAELGAEYPVSNYEDPRADKVGHVPYTQEFFSALGTMIARCFYFIHTPPYKAIVLDCDHTLWRGVCGEDGACGVQVDSACRALQEFVIAQRAAGMMVCLCSKNNEEDVWKVFEQNSGMILKREHILASRINWRPKSENLRSLADELRLGLDSFIFLDDSAVECAEVEARSPEVLALQLPMETREMSKLLSSVWAFDHRKTTQEDRNRSELYATDAKREHLRTRSLSLDEFLAGLELSVEISPMQDADLARVSQISQRTNQFNFTTIRRSEVEMERLCRTGETECLVVRLRDRFGDYGLVGAMIFTANSGLLDVDSIMLSCRALGRRVEHRMLAHLGGIARARGLERLRINFTSTTKNKPAREFLDSIGAKFGSSNGDAYRFEFSSVLIAGLCEPGQAASAPSAVEAKASSPLAPPVESKSHNNGIGRSRILKRIAVDLCDSEKVSQAIAAANVVQLRPAAGYAAPETPLQASLASLWAEILKVDAVGIHDDFFELGGHSLMAMQLAFKIQETFNVDFGLESFLQTPVLAAQAERLQELLLEEAGDAEYLEQLIDELEQNPQDIGPSGAGNDTIASGAREPM